MINKNIKNMIVIFICVIIEFFNLFFFILGFKLKFIKKGFWKSNEV